MTDLNCMTWNLHRCRGRDGVNDPDRTVDTLVHVLATEPADIVVLTEADAEQPPYGAILDLGKIESAAGLRSAHLDASLRWSTESNGFLGTVVLHSPRLSLLRGHLIDLPGHYPRGAAVFDFAVDGDGLRLVATHLSLVQPLRIAQMRAIGQYLARQDTLPTVLVGDLNEWRPWGGLAFSQSVVGRAFTGPAVRSFPARFPALPLDRVMAMAPANVTDARVLSQPSLRDISDHLPVRARVRLG